MSGATERLTKILRELHQVLESAEDLDRTSRDSLRAAAREIEDALDSEEGQTAAAAPVEALRDRIERFEGSHPALTEAVRRIVDQLAEMGI
jgi:hypothetical protein